MAAMVMSGLQNCIKAAWIAHLQCKDTLQTGAFTGGGEEAKKEGGGEDDKDEIRKMPRALSA